MSSLQVYFIILFKLLTARLSYILAQNKGELKKENSTNTIFVRSHKNCSEREKELNKSMFFRFFLKIFWVLLLLNIQGFYAT